MKNNLGVPMVALLLPICFITCKKSPDPVHIKTNTELISQSTWKFDKATVSGIDVSSYVQACQKDNIITFLTAGTGTLDEGVTKCSLADPQTSPFTWGFLNNETTLHISTVLFTGGSSDFTIITLSETQLVLSQNITINGSTQNAVVTFKH